MAILEQLGIINTLVPLGLAAVFGAMVGFERQLHSNWTGMRTHMMVSMGSAAFVLAACEVFGTTDPSLTRVVQGVAAGVGFIGAGTILKLSDRLEVRGLTTAATVWVSSAVGTSCGLGVYRVAVWSTLLAIVVLGLLRPLEKEMERRHASSKPGVAGRHDESNKAG